MVADSTQTLLCTYLSAVLLVGLVLNAALGWSWADPIAALVIAAVAVRKASRPGAANSATTAPCPQPRQRRHRTQASGSVRAGLRRRLLPAGAKP